jgi:hypothetical protein
MKTKADPRSAKGGRPSKFDEPSRPVTMTLPDRILDRLAEIDDDRAKAVVKAVEAALKGSPSENEEPVRELRVAEDEALLVVARSRLLASIPWLTMIELAPGRNLISLRNGVPIEKLEVTLGDLIDSNPRASAAERRILQTLLEKIRTPRRNQAVRTDEVLVVRSLPKDRE